MTAIKGLGTTGNAAGVVTSLDHKLAQAGQVAKASATTIRPGLFWGGSATIVSGTAGMAYSVAAFSCVTTRGASAGAVFGGNDGTLSVATTAAPGANSRYDVIYLWHREYALDGTDSNPVIGVVQGTAAASPTVPSLAAYPGAIELARVLVPAGVTATNSGTTITQTAPFTAMDGGRIPFRNTTERDAGTYLEAQLGWLIDTDVLQVYNGSSWVPVVPSLSHAEYTATSGSQASGSAGSVGTLTAAAGETNDSGLFTVSTNTLTVLKAGLYSVSVQGSIPAAPTGAFWVRCTVGSVQLFLQGSTSTEQIGGSLMSAYRLPAGTVLTFTFLHTSAASRVLTSRIMLTKVGDY